MEPTQITSEMLSSMLTDWTSLDQLPGTLREGWSIEGKFRYWRNVVDRDMLVAMIVCRCPDGRYLASAFAPQLDSRQTCYVHRSMRIWCNSEGQGMQVAEEMLRRLLTLPLFYFCGAYLEWQVPLPEGIDVFKT
jgi:hypothetical protein